MEKLVIVKFFIPVAIVCNIFAGPTLNLLTFLNTWILESHWSIFIDNIGFANLMALSFILFTVIFITSMKFVEKVAKSHILIIGALIIGFSCVYASFIYIWEIVILVFVITGIATAFYLPAITKYTIDKVENKYENSRYVMILPISALIWIAISYLLILTMGESWRLLYFITGILNILTSLIFVFL